MSVPARMIRSMARAGLFAFCVAGGLLVSSAPAGAQMELPGLHQARGETYMEQAHAINIALFSYSTDHDQAYPTGKSSTEIFQQLIDGGYVTDPKVFYLPMPGKVVPGSLKLKPENVCFDITAGVDANSPDSVPFVFSTGYKIHYTTDGAAVPLAQPPPPGIAVAYKAADSSKYLGPSAPDGTVANVVSPPVDPAGKTFQQLTPEGPLAP